MASSSSTSGSGWDLCGGGECRAGNPSLPVVESVEIVLDVLGLFECLFE
jgi:hypothetical protein